MDGKDTIKIFMVDDDNLTIDLLARAFNKSKFITFSGRANSGEECLRKLKNQSVDLVLMDINMPGIDGIETAELLLEGKKENPPKIIFLTVYGDYAYAQKAFDLKASLLGKNVGIEYLISTIDRVYKGEIVINPNPKGIIKEDGNAKLKFVLKKLLKAEQINIACRIRNGEKTEEIALAINRDTHYVNNQKKDIKRRLEPLKENINAAFLGALMESSGLCEPLVFDNLDDFLPKLR